MGFGFLATKRLEGLVSQASDVATQRQELLFQLLVNFDKVRGHKKKRGPWAYEIAHRVYILQNMDLIPDIWNFNESNGLERIYDTTLLNVDLRRLEEERFVSYNTGYRVGDSVCDSYFKGRLDLEGKSAPDFARIIEQTAHRVVDDLAKILYFAQHGKGKVDSIKSRKKCCPYKINEGRYDKAMALYERLKDPRPRKQHLL